MRSKRKAKVAGVGVALLVAMAMFALSGCSQPGDLSSDSSLLSITVAGVSPAGGNFGTPWSGGVWVEGGWMDVVPGEIFLTARQMENMAVRVSAVGGASVWYAVTDAPGVEPWFENVSEFYVERGGGILWVQIFSPNMDSLSIYAFNINNRTPRLTNVSVERFFGGGGNAFTHHRFAESLGTPAESLADVVPGEIFVGTNELAGTVTLGTSQNINITLNIALEYDDDEIDLVITSGDAIPDFQNNAVDMSNFDITDLGNGDWLNIRVGSDREQGTVSFYRIRVTARNDDFTLVGNRVYINNVPVELGLLGHNSLVGQEAWGNYYNGAQLVNRPIPAVPFGESLTVTATPTAGTTTVGFAHTDSHLDYLMGAFVPNNNLGDLDQGRIIAMQVTNELGETAYYRFRIARGSYNTTLTGITIGDVPITNLGTPASIVVTPGAGFFAPEVITWPNGVPALISLTEGQADAFAGSNASAVTAHSGATVRFARGTGDGGATPANPGTAASWNAAGTGLFPNVASVFTTIFIEVTAENGMNTTVYAVQVRVDTPPVTISSLTIGDVTTTSLGTPAFIVVTPGFFGATITWPGGVPGALSMTAAQAADLDNLVVSAVGMDGHAIRFARGTGAALMPPNPTAPAVAWNTTGTGFFSPPLAVNNARIYAEVSNRFGMVTAYAVTVTVQD